MLLLLFAPVDSGGTPPSSSTSGYAGISAPVLILVR